MTFHQLTFTLPTHRLVQCSAAKLDDPLHHLRRNHSGVFQLRAMIARGPKFTGQRMIISLKTHDEAEAAARRDIALESLRRAELLSERNVPVEKPTPAPAIDPADPSIWGPVVGKGIF